MFFTGRTVLGRLPSQTQGADCVFFRRYSSPGLTSISDMLQGGDRVFLQVELSWVYFHLRHVTGWGPCVFQREQEKLLWHNQHVLSYAKQQGMDVVDTFNITMARYSHFLQGRCACHFHRVSARVPSCALEQVEVRGIPLYVATVGQYHRVSARVAFLCS